MRSLALSCLAGALFLSIVSLARADETTLARGEYLTRQGNCQGCHTRPDGAPFAGGVAFDTPFGRLYSSNITPDRQQGLGDWTVEEFRRALQEGFGRNGEQLYPAFPYTAYTRLSDEDVAAIFAFLRVQRPVTYAPPANALRFPFDQRALIRGWKWLNFTPGPLPALADAKVARGAYLAEAVGHCQECHTPRTWSQGLDRDRAYAGATQQGWTAWNLTSDQRGLGGWSDAKLSSYLREGHQRGEAVAAGPMAEVVSGGTRYLSDADLGALVAYLRTLPAKPGAVPARAEVQPLGEGGSLSAAEVESAALLQSACASCHAPDDQGPAGPYPRSFGNYSAVRDPAGTNLVRVLLDGIDRQGRTEHAFMPAYRDLLSDQQLADLANYIGRHFGGQAADVRPADVAAAREREK
ncbi:c-type cytochrome [Pseudomonas sp. EpS/L25]|uniref:c-type cytochrome n=1 Tax=Pseudomonas sp. EpS/L25 TaxID=1749078 RepID=UPI0007432C0F|nr:cytochrome c [Pseudomonas sp. EpS/L25]KUM44322.1 cytochrome C [Pseudomonas sp. EpS/L25]